MVGRMVRVGGTAQLIRMCSMHDVVHAVALAMGAGYDAQAAVLDARVDQIVHGKDLQGEVGIAERIVPSPPVLMPEEGR